MSDLFRTDAQELAEDAQRLLIELDREVPGVAAVNAECRPAVDVLETSSSVEVLGDVPGVPPASLRVAMRRSTLLIVGAKLAAPTDPSARFHLAERTYGRFARAVRLSGAFDTRGARATTAAGQLRVVLPRIADRRGEVVAIPVETP